MYIVEGKNYRPFKEKVMQLINRCMLCKRQEESIEHLFIICEETQIIWNFIGGSIGINFVRITSLRERLKMPAMKRLSMFGEIFWESNFYVIAWELWLERNKRCFKGVEKELT